MSVGQTRSKWERNNPEKVREYKARWSKKRYAALTPDQRRTKVEAENLRRRRRWQESIQHYGGECYCCKEDNIVFLSLDHIDGNGTQHRRELGGVRVDDWARRNGWPPVLRVACHNCNFGAHLNGGVCPHQEQEGKKEMTSNYTEVGG